MRAPLPSAVLRSECGWHGDYLVPGGGRDAVMGKKAELQHGTQLTLSS